MLDGPSHPASLPPEQLLDQCAMRLTRRGGPGGQHRNKVETAVILRHQPSGVSAEANERRSQAANRSVALFRLRVNLALEIRAERDTAALPSPLWRSRCRGGRISVGQRHDDFPALLAEALDAIAAAEADVIEAAGSLGCTASQLVKLLKKEPRAIIMVNQWRTRQGLHPLN